MAPVARASSTWPGVGVTKEKPSAPITAPGWAMKRSPIRTRAPIRTPLRSSASRADHRVLGDRDVAEDARAGRRSATRAPMATKGPIAAPAPISAVGSITALGWMPGAISGGRSKTRPTPART